MPRRVSKQHFAELVERALAELPEAFASHLEHVRLEILPRPTKKQLREAELGPGETLFGLYVGINIVEASVTHSGTLPEVIYIFQEPHEEAFDTDEELVKQVRITVLHEIGHHFGLDEEELEDLLE